MSPVFSKEEQSRERLVFLCAQSLMGGTLFMGRGRMDICNAVRAHGISRTCICGRSTYGSVRSVDLIGDPEEFVVLVAAEESFQGKR